MTLVAERGFDILHWGDLVKLARRAAALACEDMRRRGLIADPLDSSVLIYTDDPSTAALFTTERDLAAICKVSAIEGVCIAMGEKFPPAAFEAERSDLEMPRVAALWFPPPGVKCPRCRNFTRSAENDVCGRCERQVEARANP